MGGKKFHFEAELLKHPNRDATYIEFPYDAEEVFGKRRVKVKVQFDGVEYRGLLVDMGLGCHMVGVTQAIRKKIGKSAGDTVDVILEVDHEERTVTIPKGLQNFLDQHPDEREFFDSLSFTNRKEYARWIIEAKRETTREKRLQSTFDKLKMRKKNPFEG